MITRIEDNVPALHVNSELEEAVIDAIREGGYPDPASQRRMQGLTSGRSYLVDLVVEPGVSGPIVIQLFYQDGSGSAQERIPYLALRLMYSVDQLWVDGPGQPFGYLVIDGQGIIDRGFFIGELPLLLQSGRYISICDKETFIAAARAGRLAPGVGS
jgi:hypothetical protein